MEDAYNLGTQDADSDFGQLDLNVLTGSEASLVPTGGPYIDICEQPKQRGFRFRYGCEGPSHGGLPGASSEKNRKTYPSVKICNYTGNAKVVVQLVTAKDPPRLHAHSLVGKQCTDDGVCIVQVGPKDMTAQFTNLGILHVTKKNVPEVLLDRIFNERYHKNPLNPNFISKSLLSAQELQHLRQESEQLAKEMDLSVVRLQFTAYLPDGEGMYTLPLEPVISNPIFDSKAPNASNLKIVRMDKTSGCVLGGDEIYLLCDKVQKDDIQIRFYEDDENGWEAYGDFGPTDVHRQFAIVFRTPRYWNISIERPITVFVQLKRRKDGETSEAKAFTYCPRVEDREEVNRKRMKRLPHFSDHFGGPSGGSPGIGGGGGAGGGGSGGFNFVNYPNNFGTPVWVNQQGMQHTGGAQGGMELAEEQNPSSQSMEASGRGPQEVQQLSDQQAPLSHSEQLFGLKALQVTERTARALLDYAITADVRMLLAVQRHLTAIQDENGDTSLHLAVIHQQPLVVQQLLQVIVSIPWQNIINVPNRLRQTPLHLGVITQQYKMVELLLTAGADAAILDRHGNSILHLALHRKDKQMVQLLVQQLKSEVLTKLIKLPDCDGLYPVHLAVKARDENMVDLLLSNGAELNVAEQKSGRSPLHLAVEIRSLKMVGHLVHAGVEVDRPTFQGNTALHLAAGYSFPELTAMLLGAGADRSAENYEPIMESDEEDDPDLGICRGHTPLDITSDQKVRDILLGQSWRWKEQNENSSEIQQGSITSLGSEALGELNKVLNQEVSGADWMKLADKLGLGSLSELLKSAKSPSKSLLDNFDISGGTIEQLINALHQLGLEKAANIIQKTESYKVLQSSDGKQSVDSAYESESQNIISTNRGPSSDQQV